MATTATTQDTFLTYGRGIVADRVADTGTFAATSEALRAREALAALYAYATDEGADAYLTCLARELLADAAEAFAFLTAR